MDSRKSKTKSGRIEKDTKSNQEVNSTEKTKSWFSQSEGDGEQLPECEKKYQNERANKSLRDIKNNSDVGSESSWETH